MSSVDSQQSESWVIVVSDQHGVDCVIGPYESRDAAIIAWREEIRAKLGYKAEATYRAIMAPAMTGEQQ